MFRIVGTDRGVTPINFLFDIVAADVTALLGMDVLYREQLVADTFFLRLVYRKLITMPDGSERYVEDWFIYLI